MRYLHNYVFFFVQSEVEKEERDKELTQAITRLGEYERVSWVNGNGWKGKNMYVRTYVRTYVCTYVRTGG